MPRAAGARRRGRRPAQGGRLHPADARVRNGPAAGDDGLHNALCWNGMEWNGMEWNGMEWDGMGWNVLEWGGMEWNGMEWGGMAWNGMEWKIKYTATCTVLSNVM